MIVAISCSIHLIVEISQQYKCALFFLLSLIRYMNFVVQIVILSTLGLVLSPSIFMFQKVLYRQSLFKNSFD